MNPIREYINKYCQDEPGDPTTDNTLAMVRCGVLKEWSDAFDALQDKWESDTSDLLTVVESRAVAAKVGQRVMELAELRCSITPAVLQQIIEEALS